MLQRQQIRLIYSRQALEVNDTKSREQIWTDFPASLNIQGYQDYVLQDKKVFQTELNRAFRTPVIMMCTHVQKLLRIPLFWLNFYQL